MFCGLWTKTESLKSFLYYNKAYFPLQFLSGFFPSFRQVYAERQSVSRSSEFEIRPFLQDVNMKKGTEHD
jgi:hypothetical protein